MRIVLPVSMALAAAIATLATAAETSVGSGAKKSQITFTKDVAPILRTAAKCVTGRTRSRRCHC